MVFLLLKALGLEDRGIPPFWPLLLDCEQLEYGGGVCADMSQDSTTVKRRRVLLLTRIIRTTLREAIAHKFHLG